MCRGFVLLSVVGLLVCPRPLFAQPTAAEAAPWRFQKYLQLHVTNGRIELRHHELGQSRTLTSGQPDGDYRQHLQLQVRPPCAVVQYEAVSPRGTLNLQLCEERRLLIEWLPAGPSDPVALRYQQPPRGDVTLAVGGQTARDVVAPSLWHLLLAEPAICRDHLLPVLAELSADWRLAEETAAIQAELFAAAAEADVVSQERSWQKLVDDLASDSFRQRQAADASLRNGGQSVAAFLRRLKAPSLSAEQRLRVERISQSFEDGSSDTPQRVAAWLLGDRALWLSLLAHPEVEVRLTAVEQLRRLTGRPIDFDPNADEKTRELELAEVARQMDRR